MQVAWKQTASGSQLLATVNEMLSLVVHPALNFHSACFFRHKGHAASQTQKQAWVVSCAGELTLQAVHASSSSLLTRLLVTTRAMMLYCWRTRTYSLHDMKDLDSSLCCHCATTCGPLPSHPVCRIIRAVRGNQVWLFTFAAGYAAGRCLLAYIIPSRLVGIPCIPACALQQHVDVCMKETHQLFLARAAFKAQVPQDQVCSSHVWSPQPHGRCPARCQTPCAVL